MKVTRSGSSVLFALASKAVSTAVDVGLTASLVLSTSSNPTMAWVIPETVLVQVGLLVGALVLSAVRSPSVLMVMVELNGIVIKVQSDA